MFKIIFAFLLICSTTFGATEQYWDNLLKGTSEVDDRSAFGSLMTAEITPMVQVRFDYNINHALVNVTNTGSGTVTQANSQALVSTGAAASSSAMMATTKNVRYRPGQGTLARFTAAFTTGKTGSEQIAGIGNTQNGFFVGFDGENFGISRRIGGDDNWTAQASFSADKLDGQGDSKFVIDPTKGNVYQIEFQWLGYGAIKFYVEDPNTGRLDLFHMISFANKSVTPSIFVPTLPICVMAENTTNDTDIIIRTASLMGGVQGRIRDMGPVHASENAKTVSDQEALITLKNADEFQGQTNRSAIRVLAMTISTDGTKVAAARLLFDSTIANQAFVDVNATQSIAQVDVAGDDVTLGSGRQLVVIDLGKSDSEIIDLRPYDIELNKGDTLTITGESTANVDMRGGIIWRDLF